MARMTITIPEGLQKLIEKCSDIDRLAPIMLKEAAPHAVEILRQHVQEKHSTAGRVKSAKYVVRNRKANRYRLVSWSQTGELTKSIKAGKPKQKKNDTSWFLDIGFTGYDSSGEAYDKIANQLEYGNSRQPATPFIDTARAEATPGVAKIMGSTYRRECGLK